MKRKWSKLNTKHRKTNSNSYNKEQESMIKIENQVNCKTESKYISDHNKV